ncbi:uncharacterized protein LOC130015692 [Mercurialis annua]|uniref:uncharacterized protein LOC130015692 n=1 Tax=Mercurialis annua TaxID=3986 RepID=UPI0024AD9F3F|nr:uncharacterized protein LOC130015692 [Mercurialis annua]
MKIPVENEVITIRGNQTLSRQCYMATMGSTVETMNIDTPELLLREKKAQKPRENLEKIELTEGSEICVKLRVDWPTDHREAIIARIKQYVTFSLEKQIAIRDEVEKLLKAGFIRKVDYPEWLANVVLIKKSNGRWRLCIDFTDLNNACPKDSFPLPNIDQLVDATCGFVVYAFLDASQGYHQILMNKDDEEKTAFTTDLGTYCYKKMPFVRSGKFLGHLISEKGIEANPKKIEAVMNMKAPKSVKEVQNLNGRVTALGSTPPVLGRPELGEILYLYLSVNDETAAEVLVKEDKGLQTPVYYLSRVLKGPEVRYPKIEKFVLALKVAAEKLRRYFEAHIIVVLADFIAETTASDQPEEADEQLLNWVLEVDGASNLEGFGVGMVLRGPHGVTLRSSVKFDFPASNNAAEYEALLIGLRMELGGKWVIEQVPRLENQEADVLAKAATVDEKIPGPLENWMQGIAHYLMDGTLPEDRDKAYKILRQAPYYAFLDGVLYRKSFTHPWSRCLTTEEGEYVLRELHEGICGAHIAPRMVAKKAVLQGYYWPLMVMQAEEIVKKCENCQRHQNIRHASTIEQCPITSSWPFATWGIDILGPFTATTGQKKFLIVAVDHFTKWIEVEAVSTITEARIRDFFWRQIVCRFGIPRALITDNGKQFNCRAFKEFCNDLHIDLRFTSVVHPQSNGITEVTNRTILKGLKARLGQYDKQWLEELPKVIWAYRTTPYVFSDIWV